jgi:hypothetical protein
MPSGPPPSAVAAIKKAREDFIANAAAKGYDPTKGDPNIIAQGYTPIVDTNASSPLRGFVSSYDKANASGYVVNYNADLSQINKATKDGWEYVYATDSATGKRYLAQIYNPEQGGAVYDSAGNEIGGLLDASGKSGDSVGQIAAVGAAFALPGVGAALAAELGVSATVGTAIASVAVQTTQGVDFETAVKNATTNAVVQTGSPAVANDIAKTLNNNPGLADAITSAGSSVVSTLAKGGNLDEAIKNAGAAVAASGASQATDDRAIGAAVGGGITGGTAGALTSAAGELGRPSTTDKGTQVASAGDITSTPGVVSDVGVVDIPGLRPKETTIADTNIQITDTIPSAKSDAAPSRKEAPVEITAQKLPTDISKTDIQTVSDVPAKEDTTQPSTKEAGATPTTSNLFVFSGQYPTTSSPLSRALGTTLQAPGGTPTATTGLTSERAPGEIEGEEGLNRQNVWNEASLRLKDALGI